MGDIPKIKHCCKAFPSFIPTFCWIKLNNDYIMPYTESKGERLRINYCPSCGSNVRDISIDEKNFFLIESNKD